MGLLVSMIPSPWWHGRRAQRLFAMLYQREFGVLYFLPAAEIKLKTPEFLVLLRSIVLLKSFRVNL
ncbi:hypothetical protein LTR17_002948 [Elasticomyces elasticus]|nr:hypothetical protein LTR17_002948 [Elasticomyces elasticus]